MKKWVFVFFGGVVGASLRFLVQTLFTTDIMLWIVNVFGSLLVGSINGYYEENGKGENLKLFLTTGLLGAFTTFSTFSESWFYYLQEDIVIGSLYGFAMTFICFLVAYVGFRWGRGKQWSIG